MRHIVSTLLIAALGACSSGGDAPSRYAPICECFTSGFCEEGVVYVNRGSFVVPCTEEELRTASFLAECRSDIRAGACEHGCREEGAGFHPRTDSDWRGECAPSLTPRAGDPCIDDAECQSADAGDAGPPSLLRCNRRHQCE